MKKINAKYIRTFNPCSSGINNFEKNYPSWSGSLEKLLMLENVSYSDKIWLAARVVDYKILQHWSLDCAEFVSSNFNNRYPENNIINDCIETIKKVLLGELDRSAASSASSAARSAAFSAWSASSATFSSAYSADSATFSSAYSAESAAFSASSAAYSADSSAYSADSAAESASSAAASSAAVSSTRSAAWSAEKDQENINISLLIALL